MKRLALAVVSESFERPDLCGPCGGRCCKTMPGAAFPHDFPGDLAVEVKRALEVGRWAIDWWHGDPRPRGRRDRTYFVRPATVGREGKRLDPSWGGACTFHGPAGCSIFATRPSGCRGLEPRPDQRHCEIRHSSKQDAAIAWVPHQKLLERLAREVAS